MKPTAHATLILAMLVAACGDDDGQPAAEGQSPAAAPQAMEEARTAETSADPCTLLTEAALRNSFDIPADTAVQNLPSTNARHPMCTYLWDKPNAEEVRAEIAKIQQERVREMMQKMRRGKRAQGLADLMDLPHVENRVNFHFAPPMETAEIARSRFQAGAEFLEQGITRRIELDNDAEGVGDTVRRHMDGEEVTFQASSEPVEGVGDAARWTPRLHQLAVLDGARILYFTVEVDVDDSVNQDRAEQLARALLN